LPAVRTRTSRTRKMNRAMAKRTFATVALAAETPEKPRKPATSEMTKKIRAHLSIMASPFLKRRAGGQNVPAAGTGCGEIAKYYNCLGMDAVRPIGMQSGMERAGRGGR